MCADQPSPHASLHISISQPVVPLFAVLRPTVRVRRPFSPHSLLHMLPALAVTTPPPPRVFTVFHHERSASAPSRLDV
jgi:hypothetical protein